MPQHPNSECRKYWPRFSQHTTLHLEPQVMTAAKMKYEVSRSTATSDLTQQSVPNVDCNTCTLQFSTATTHLNRPPVRTVDRSPCTILFCNNATTEKPHNQTTLSTNQCRMEFEPSQHTDPPGSLVQQTQKLRHFTLYRYDANFYCRAITIPTKSCNISQFFRHDNTFRLLLVTEVVPTKSCHISQPFIGTTSTFAAEL